MKRIILNEEGNKLLQLKKEVDKLSPGLAESFIKVSNYKKELLNKKITLEVFEEILKTDNRYILSKGELESYFANEYFDKIETLTDKKFSADKIGGTCFIRVYIGMTKGDYSKYFGIDIDVLNRNEEEMNFAKKVATRRINVINDEILDLVKNSINIPKIQSKSLIIKDARHISAHKRYLCDKEIIFSFPVDYIESYKKLDSMVLSFLNAVWEGIENYKTF